ncbi:hypothetical protein TNCV_626351 [Trichonephila clavipes]|nr:hypothetical protein TNCV_626351 [Trichonephila clavipes]
MNDDCAPIALQKFRTLKEEEKGVGPMSAQSLEKRILSKARRDRSAGGIERWFAAKQCSGNRPNTGQAFENCRCSRMIKVSDRGWPSHEFDPSTTKEPPCRGEMHVKSDESSSIIPLV